MPLYRLGPDNLEALQSATFSELGIKERTDLQRLLRNNIEAIAGDCLLLAEEFSHWEDSKRRIDLLALDRDANLVVVELKRDEGGGHMELQALRYAAMVSTMTFHEAVDAHARFLAQHGGHIDARTNILDFLGWPSPDENNFAQDVRIVLASAGFSKELTTSVLWLNQRDLDIRCVRIRPYRFGSDVVLDVQQVVPLPEAEDYQVQLRQKVREERSRTDAARDFTRYDLRIDGKFYSKLPKRELVFRVVQYSIDQGATPEAIASIIESRYDRLWREADGEMSSEDFAASVSERSIREGRAFDPRRFFRSDDELIRIGGKTYALSNQWGGPRALDAVDALLTKYGGGKVTYEPSPESFV
ncbi:hypothetical protein RY831_29480 [Noviherbaspirillum sp. CPCC 100848]|uniref:DUF91 domain-containing protein n=1 Tax=Noviherbaspirillum album TaxID=3080276 RepID=A0ABU6JHY4_9BURK|nr:hypothetical protein [Noviherbaspirillum sp. CPCC 100848]MEC4723293.1 hypothetical protein [Noviherbaspirillum sp. CPCC 100848]